MAKKTAPAPLPEDKRSWTNSNGESYTASLIRVDDGHKWYAFDEPLKMVPYRALEAEFAAEWANLNFTPADLKAYIQRMRKEGNSGNIVTMFSVLDRMEERLDWACDRKSLLELAKVYFLIDDEPLEAPTKHHNALKEELWSKNADCAGFFLQQAFVLTKGFTAFSGTDIHTYLLAQELRHLRTPSESAKSDAPASGSIPSRKSFMEGVKNLTRKSPSPAKSSRAK